MVDSDAAHVEVHSGVVTLTGAVDGWGQVEVVEEHAREAGATAVVNDLQVASDNGSS